MSDKYFKSISIKKILIVSPSGNFYGSEQVLMDYLKFSKLKSDVAVPRSSLFFKILSESRLPQKILTFKATSVRWFYCRVLVWLLFGRYNVLYINEAGHSRYILRFAKLFQRKKFVIHVRILEDTSKNRWDIIPSENLTIIAISRYLQKLIPYKSNLLYDPYLFSPLTPETGSFLEKRPLIIGIIGRISWTKGLQKVIDLIQYLQEAGDKNYLFYFYGEEGYDVKGTGTLDRLLSTGMARQMGFILDRSEIYKSIDIVLHLSTVEALGRIFFEAIDNGKPFIGFDAAGIGEIGHLMGLDELLIDPAEDDYVAALYRKIELVGNNYARYSDNVNEKKQIAAEVFNIYRYTEETDKILMS